MLFRLPLKAYQGQDAEDLLTLMGLANKSCSGHGVDSGGWVLNYKS